MNRKEFFICLKFLIACIDLINHCIDLAHSAGLL